MIFKCIRIICSYLGLLGLWFASCTYGAKVIDVAKPEQLKSILRNLRHTNQTTDIKLRERYKHTDINGTTHLHMQQTYANLPVWNGEIVLHLKENSNSLASASSQQPFKMNGVIFDALQQDLKYLPSDVFTQTTANEARHFLAKIYPNMQLKLTDMKVQPIIFVDDEHQAHYAYHVSSFYDDLSTGGHRPTLIIDAKTYNVYRHWDEIKYSVVVKAGGIGGNKKTGPIIYDGDYNHASALMMQVNDEVVYEGFNVCRFSNDRIILQDVGYPDQQALLATCYLDSNKHNATAWLTLDYNETQFCHDEINGAYSPSLDAFYATTIAMDMFNNWYGLPIVAKPDGSPSVVKVRVHYGRHFENAFWDGVTQSITFGDGGEKYFPLTSLDMTVHELSHGFTDQHSQIDYSIPAMAALHEAFSDAAAMAAEYYVTGKNTWGFGSTLSKQTGAIRYIDDPKRNGAGISHSSEFKSNLEAHAAAGALNRAFYLLATSKDWNTKMAFDVFVKANVDYWNASMKTFEEAACGMLMAAKDLGYQYKGVETALNEVGIQPRTCSSL